MAPGAQWGGIFNGLFTSHVLLTLEYNERVAAVWLLFLVWLLIGVSVPDDANLRGKL